MRLPSIKEHFYQESITHANINSYVINKWYILSFSSKDPQSKFKQGNIQERNGNNGLEIIKIPPREEKNSNLQSDGSDKTRFDGDWKFQ